MFPEKLKRILNLVKKTGDRVIVFDGNEPDNSYVIMSFDNYETLNTPPSMVNKSFLVNNITESAPISQEIPQKIVKSDNLTEEDLTDKINREISIWKNGDNSSFTEDENRPKKVWQISPKVKDKAQEIE